MRWYSARLQESNEALSYLSSRGVDRQVAATLGLGFASGHGLREHLLSVGFREKQFYSSGLFTERGERFTGMVVVPDFAGSQAHWFAGRAVSRDAQPRFQALPGPKPVLGLVRLPRSSPWLVVAEGLFDWIVLISWGIPACAALGTQGLEKVAASLRGQPRVFIAFDSDDAGQEATRRLRQLLGEHRSRVVALPEGVGDVAELGAHPGGRSAFIHCLQRGARAAH